MQDDDENLDGLLKLFVGGLNYLSLQSDIKSYFETFGKVINCTLLIDKASGKSRGFAFVSIEDYSKFIFVFFFNSFKNFLTNFLLFSLL
jgi:RNA recognition motif-containing protein